MFERKLKKLVKKPGLFFKDMIRNKKNEFKNVIPLTVSGQYNYTVVSAVYNVDKYLDDYFKGFFSQVLSFKKHIQLILVDDGSLDKSAEIIKKWQKKYPDNIKYIWKENGGQSSARNMGLQYVNTEWVTFIDPDDFVDRTYFKKIDDFLYENKKNTYYILVAKIINYIEHTNTFKDVHPLNYKFSKGNASFPIEGLCNNIQLSAASAIFKTSALISSQIKFDSNVRPSFEDAKFIADFLLNIDKGMAGIISDARYYYRKRKDGTSTLDTAWEKHERFTHVPKFGYLEILKKYYAKKGFVPINIQRVFLYEMVWHLKWLLNKSEKISFLTQSQKNDYISVLTECFKYVDMDVILNFELAGCYFYHKVGMLSLFKSISVKSQIVYIESYDKYKKSIQLRYFTNVITNESIQLDGVDTFPSYTKTIDHDFIGRQFLIERRVWVSIGNATSIKFNAGNLPTRLSLAGKHHINGINISLIKKHFEDLAPGNYSTPLYSGAWLMMDRDTQADDNAEHLYRYIVKNHPDQKVFFILRKDSHDWERLRKNQFNLIEFGSKDHEDALKSCSKIISSHADKYITNYLGARMLQGRHFVFLQHGITKDDISGWLNQKEHIDLFITASPDEYNSIVENGSKYYYGKKEVKLTGFPRHDQLVKFKEQPERLIIIMPTWRLSIVGKVKYSGNEREINPNFMNTQFATHWYKFLHSNELKKLSQHFGYKVAFFPHVNLQCYLPQFNVPGYIDVILHKDVSIQNIFSKAALLITDYSSVAFEMAVQNKQTIYYQFDESDCFSGAHIYSKGYFNYRTHGFGPVVINENQLINTLKEILKNNALPSSAILERIRNTFPCRDGKCCERVYHAIKNLDSIDSDESDLDIVRDYAYMAFKSMEWDLSVRRWEYYINHFPDVTVHDFIAYILSLQYTGKVNEAIKFISFLISCDIKNSREDLFNTRALLYFSLHRWDEAIADWEDSGNAVADNKMYCLTLAYRQECKKLDCLSKKEPHNKIIIACSLFACNRYKELIDFLDVHKIGDNFNCTIENPLSININDLWEYLWVIKALAYRSLNEHDMANNIFIELDKLNKGGMEPHYELARIAHSDANIERVISQLNIVSIEIDILPMEFVYYYICALNKLSKPEEAKVLYGKLNEACLTNDSEIKYFLEICMVQHDWNRIIDCLKSTKTEHVDRDYYLCIAYKNLSEYELAYKHILNSIYEFNESKWLIRSELAQICDNWEDAYICWINYIKCQGIINSKDSFDKLLKLKFMASAMKKIIY